MSSLHGIEHLEKDLWDAADQLRANSKLTSSEYVMPVLGLIFLRHANNRFQVVHERLTREFREGKSAFEPERADYLAAGALWLPEAARWSFLMSPAVPHADLGVVLVAAMEAIEASFPALKGTLPKDYGIFERKVLEDLLRIFHREALSQASGDVFGRIYEYFLMNFALQGAQDNGEFFTPPSLVHTIVNVIEPYSPDAQVTVLDPACGSGGMFVQSGYFIQQHGGEAPKRALFYGQEKTATTIKLAKMNLAVHGLEGDIREANTFYQDEHNLVGKADFVMANPPFNVDAVDAGRVAKDPRLPFGLPGVNKEKAVSNGNYLWISYFWSYLKPTGRAGFVMSSQASSAGNQEREVRKSLVKTGDVDVMVAIRSGFFYTRTVPCELWFLDRGKPAQRKDTVLMLDARNVHRKVTRKVYDFSPDQLAQLTAIVWLYRGETDRYLDLVASYFAHMADGTSNAAMEQFLTLAEHLRAALGRSDLDDTLGLLAVDYRSAWASLSAWVTAQADQRPTTNEEQTLARHAVAPVVDRWHELAKQVDLAYKAAVRLTEAATEDRRSLARRIKELDEVRGRAVEELRFPHQRLRQVAWLQEKFPAARLVDVPGLVKVVTLADIEAADWSLTPGRYVGVAPEVLDEDFDFEQTLRDIHVELADLNAEAARLAETIQKNFEGLGI